MAMSVGWLVGRPVGWLVGNAFVRRSTRRTLLAYLALFFFLVAVLLQMVRSSSRIRFKTFLDEKCSLTGKCSTESLTHRIVSWRLKKQVTRGHNIVADVVVVVVVDVVVVVVVVVVFVVLTGVISISAESLSKTSDAGSQYRCGKVGRSIQPPTHPRNKPLVEKKGQVL